ncbi:NADP-dependent 3-hydroxy acid dehydrogenase YdfG [Haloactinopolyspora alba]|uniref:NADP-dependent 3-hydroxy acid dehydrogenase YdfG n=1 Tax=Haloactinopolyspora alba TaxID=648780 RepID=A0A2P8DZS0_9ACTN|nr:SDR family oxidoreductase [Haloactinopolyspora alba]PSL02699.1 NADP-dependent 3-hydroxy acid dehydrogenase YdfG [Haloactinopolyspora alba]
MDVVVVTGASGGTGRAIARRFGEKGAAVALLARGQAGLEAAADDVRAAGGRTLALPVDVADAGALAQAAGQVEIELGPIDTWVNVAMTSVLAPFTKIEPEEFERVTDVTYLGYVYGTKVALDRMLPRDRGTIVQVGSALAYRGIPLQSAYCGAKHALRGFHESLRCELLHEGSHVNLTMVHLPAMNTPQFDWALTRLPHHAQPVPPIYQPEVGARAVLHAAAHPGRREYWVGRSTVGTIVANKFAGGLLDRYLARTAFASQQTDQPLDPDAPANLWEPVDDVEDYGAHGEFDGKSITRSYQMWASRHRYLLGAATGAATGALASVWGVARCRRRSAAADRLRAAAPDVVRRYAPARLGGRRSSRPRWHPAR